MTIYDVEPINLTGIRSVPIGARASKVTASVCARPPSDRLALGEFWRGLPDLLAARDLRRVVASMVRARREGRAIVWGLGAHVIKVGLAPVLIDLMERGYVDAIACNGAVFVHDFELALAGATSEDVDATLHGGTFGVTSETTAAFCAAVEAARDLRIGLGEAVGKTLDEHRALLHPELSLLHAAYRRRVPVMMHIAIGTDVTHLHAGLDAGALGSATHRDFLLFCSVLERSRGGGVYLNVGSAVVLPEVLLKALAVLANIGRAAEGLITVNFDFANRYRTSTNVVRRPSAAGGAGYEILGHHEIMIPLLAAGLGVEEMHDGAE